jgi:hypothetical protein
MRHRVEWSQPSPATTLRDVPKFWIWTQAAIVIFVLAGMIIAIVKIA